MTYNLQRQFDPHIIAKLEDAHLSDSNVHQCTHRVTHNILKAVMHDRPHTHENKSMSHLCCWMAC